jgi:hypothetical protein
MHKKLHIWPYLAYVLFAGIFQNPFQQNKIPAWDTRKIGYILFAALFADKVKFGVEIFNKGRFPAWSAEKFHHRWRIL